ncbi:MAG TPA: polysaccharide biosynthesis/export family protein [Stellaceae bacterium]|nr:polysaccharide biosynthesis/export family protein [Stellaceae bacterium]
MPLYRTLICAGLLTLTLAACARGPLGRDVVEQARSGGRISFDVVDLNDNVLATVLAHRPPPFTALFKKYLPPPELTIAVGDTLSIVIWEAAPNGLFGNSLAQLALPPGGLAALRTGQVPNPGGMAPLPAGLNPSPTSLAPLYGFSEPAAAAAEEAENQPSPGAAPTAPNSSPFAGPGGAANAGSARGQAAGGAGMFVAPQVRQLLAVATESSGPGTAIPDQQVGADGGISIPYAGRIGVAGKTPHEVAQIIEKRLASLAIEPQALVTVTHSAANSVTVTGDAIAGARVPLSPSGDRLLQVIAAAGGANAPIRDTQVELTRAGVTARVPLATLIADPSDDIFAEPGDLLTLDQEPRTFSVFGATGENNAITFTRDHLSLSEALAQAGGLLDDRADARAVFVFRYEPISLVHALGQPVASDAHDGLSPVVYRLNLKQAKSFLLARRFPVHNGDVIFVADAPTQPLYYFFQALQQVTGPVVTGFLTCQATSC